MKAIQHKSKSAELTADKAIVSIGIAEALCFIIAFVLMVYAGRSPIRYGN